MQPIKILFIATSHDTLGATGRRTGVWLEELAAPYYIFKDAGAVITVASPNGGEVPLDPKSESIIVATPSTKRFLKDAEAMNFLSQSIRLEEVNASEFDVVFLPGGHGPMWDIAGNGIVKQLLEVFYTENKPIGAVCHGVAGLLSVQNSSGDLVIKDKQLTGFSNSEEELSGLAKIVPFLLESELISAGASYTKASDYMNHVVVDGNLITGQNPASSEEVARKILIMLKSVSHTPAYSNPTLINV